LTTATIHATVETALMVAFSGRLPREPRCFQRRGSLPPSKPQYKFSLECFDADDRAFGVDDVAAALYNRHRVRKLRFLMTDNIKSLEQPISKLCRIY
jgi:hypothetical protein